VALPLMSERLDQPISGAQVPRAWDGTNEATWNAQHNTLRAGLAVCAEPAAPNKMIVRGGEDIYPAISGMSVDLRCLVVGGKMRINLANTKLEQKAGKPAGKRYA